MNEKNAPEIERKYLIAYPDMTYLKSNAEGSYILQTYLNSENKCTSRVRKRVSGGKAVYTYTSKQHITAMSRMEYEREIDKEEYEELLKNADMNRKPVEKERYCLNYKNQLFEIDIYPFYSDRAIMEIELESEDQAIEFPPEIKIIREVTEDKRYTNASLARSVPYDDI